MQSTGVVAVGVEPDAAAGDLLAGGHEAAEGFAVLATLPQNVTVAP